MAYARDVRLEDAAQSPEKKVALKVSGRIKPDALMSFEMNKHLAQCLK